MNFAHVHLLLNHIPVIGLPVALSFLLFSLLTNNMGTQRFGYFVLIALAILTVPTYFTGEPAEHVIRHLPDFSERYVSAHENSALISVILTSLTGVLALSALYFQKNEARRRFLGKSVFVVACLATLSLAYTSNLGGEVRHSELRALVNPPPAPQEPGATRETPEGADN